MKKHYFFVLLTVLILSFSYGKAQTTAVVDATKKTTEIKYRRSSLHLVLVESDNFPQKETVMAAYYNAPFPDKYNDHTVGSKSFNPSSYPLAESEKIKPKAGGRLGGALTDAIGASIGGGATEAMDNDRPNTKLIIDKFIKDKKIGNQLVAKWFNRKEDGSFDMNLVGERGSYSATDMEANVAKGSSRGVSSLADAGEELIKNTFVVFTKLNFVENEPIARTLRDAAIESANKNVADTTWRKVALATAEAAYQKGKEGYSVWTTAYLYKLKWDDEISATFYNTLWMSKDKIDSTKKKLFDNTNFELEFVGDEKATSLVTFSFKETRTQEQIVSLSTSRNIESVYSKLQKKYEVFKPKIPLFTGNPITAKIGLKEGIEGGDKFEVLEQTVDPKTGLTSYKRKGKITVDKHLIWDNRFNAGEEAPATIAVSDSSTTSITGSTLVVAQPKAPIDRTTFKGDEDYYPGMLIRQIK